MRKSTMFRMTLVLGAMLFGAVAFAQMGGGEEEALPPKWTIANPAAAETFHHPVTSIGVGGGHTPEGVSAYVCKIREIGFGTLTGSVGGNCNQDGSWSNTISFNTSPPVADYSASVYPSNSSEADDFKKFGIIAHP